MQKRQGDVFMDKLEPRIAGKIDREHTIKASNVLARGEVTGHDHVVTGDVVEIFQWSPSKRPSNTSVVPDVLWRDNTVWVVVGPGGATVNHTQNGAIVDSPEHLPVTLEEGTWEVRIQHEYTPTGMRRTYD